MTVENASRWLIDSGVDADALLELTPRIVEGVRLGLLCYPAGQIAMLIRKHGKQPKPIDKFLTAQQRKIHRDRAVSY